MVSEMFPVGNLFDLPEVKRGLTSKTSRLEQAIDLYSPDDYPPDVVLINKDTWVGYYDKMQNLDFGPTYQTGGA